MEDVPMTYQRTSAVRRYRKRPPQLSGWLEDIVSGLVGVPGVLVSSGPSTNQCIAQANAEMAPFEAKIDDLIKTWNPTGTYTAQDIRDIVSATMMVIQQGQAAIDRARLEPNASQDSVMRATDDLARAGGRSLDFLQAARDADAGAVAVIEAPGLKRWVTDSMGTASSAMVTASVIGCITPWWVGALSAFQGAFDVGYGVAKRIVGVVIAAGETVLKVADDLPELYDILKWGALAAAGYYVWTRYLRVP
jgi:hypothetical protein